VDLLAVVVDVGPSSTTSNDKSYYREIALIDERYHLHAIHS
jgi:hypothetical protein